MRLFLSVILCLQFAPAALSSPPGRTITLAEAKSLVLTSLAPEQKKLPKLEAVQYDNANTPRFLFFTVTWEGGANRSVVVGNFAVDSYTGDVWSASAECTEESNPELRKLQAKIRASLKLSHSDYLRLKTKGPLCAS
jgi:hypothetical protein